MPAPDVPTLVLRDITKIAELREVEQLQKDVWGVADLEVFPALALIPMIEVGGLLVGAFDQERMVGFVFGFPGREQGKAILHSDMLAVRAEYRRHGLGYKLKLAQRERALAAGIDTITWTFDPLQARNARLNFGKLGVIADSYRVDYYGETTSFLHQTGTDRLWVTWQLNSDRVRRRIEVREQTASPADDLRIVVRVGENEEPLVTDCELQKADAALIEIPGDINQLAATDIEMASHWRAASRKAFLELVEAGYCVTEFDFADGPRGRIGRYLLTREPVEAGSEMKSPRD
jgi:predicted GNAT superfamily acetyltransferase